MMYVSGSDPSDWAMRVSHLAMEAAAAVCTYERQYDDGCGHVEETCAVGEMRVRVCGLDIVSGGRVRLGGLGA
jgi:hypothetical protein